MTTQAVLAAAKAALTAAYGPRLRGVVLYGSRARGDARPDSDVDLLVLDSALLSDAQPVDVAAYEAAEFSLYRDARREGVMA